MKRCYWLALVWLTTSCVREVSLPLEPPPALLVVSGLLTAGEPVSLQVTRVGAPFDPDSAAWIRDATVTAYRDDRFAGLLAHTLDATYVLPDSAPLPQPGEKWRFSVSAIGFPDVATEPEEIPHPPQLLSAEFQDSIFPPPSPSLPYAGIITLNLSDPPDAPNQYRIFLDLARNDTLIPGNWNFLPIAPSFEACGWYGTALADSCFDGSLFPLKLQASAVIFAPQAGRNLPADSLKITLWAISPTYFQYLIQPDPSPIEQIFAKPNPPFSNVRGGYGVIGSQACIKRSIPRQ